MNDHPTLKKLRLQSQSPVLIYNAPEEYQSLMAEISAEIHKSPKGKYEFIHIFVKNASEVVQFAASAVQNLQGDGTLWVSYPKKSSKKYKSDISRDHGWEALGELGFEPVTQVSIDQDWSALRFRRVEYIKKLTRKGALSPKGKERITKND